jgi:hypothetical protein
LDSNKRQWEQALIDAYHDFRWREVLEPLYEKFRRWEAGELDHAALGASIRAANGPIVDSRRFFAQKRSVVVKFAQWEREWFEDWVSMTPRRTPMS